MLYSVIVPIYNREKSIKKCVDSILRQSEKNFELILVDDGSTDNTFEICEKYKEIDQRIVVIHKDNGGVSSARNVGIDVAKGKYIVFVDSDDYVDEDYLKILNHCNSDFVISGVIFEKTKEKMIINDNTINIDDNRIIGYLKDFYSLIPYAKKYDKNIIDKYNIRFNNLLKYGEDTLFCAEYIKRCKTVSYINKFTYHICDIDSDSLSKIKGIDFIKQYDLVQKNMFNLFKDNYTIKNFLIPKYLWYAEKTFKEIAKSDLNYTEKINRINLILKSDYFKTCIKKCEKSSLTTVNRICYKFGLSRLILYRMKKSN